MYRFGCMVFSKYITCKTSCWRMRSSSIHKVQNSFFADLDGKLNRFSRVFFDNLSECDEAIRPLWGDNTRESRKLFEKHFRYFIENLNAPELLHPLLRQLAHLSVGSDNVEATCQHMKHAFMVSLSAAFGDKFQSELREAWLALVLTVAEIVKNEAMVAVEG